MTGPQLKDLRISRNLNQAELATFLGDCSGATISRWEGSTAAVPQWVSDKMLASTEISLPLTMLQQMLDYAASQKMDFSQLLSKAVSAFLTPTPEPPKILPGPKTHYIQDIHNPPPEPLRVADTPLG